MPVYLGARKTKDPSRHARGLRVGLCGLPAVRRALLGADAPADNNAAGRHAPSLAHLPESSCRYPPAGAQPGCVSGCPSRGAYCMRGLALLGVWIRGHGRRAGVRFRPSVSVTPAHTARTPATRVLHLPGGVRTVCAGVPDTDVRKKYYPRLAGPGGTHPSSRAAPAHTVRTPPARLADADPPVRRVRRRRQLADLVDPAVRVGELSRSDFCSAPTAATVPCMPGMPRFWRWLPGKPPRAISVVATGMPVSSASSSSSGLAPP